MYHVKFILAVGCHLHENKPNFVRVGARTDAGVMGNSSEGWCSRQQVRAVLDGGKA
jgi:hypothetical protein